MGLLADARNARAVERVVAIKRRFAPSAIAVLLPGVRTVPMVATEFPAAAERLADEHWPGPLTILLPARDDLPAALVSDGKIGVRVPGESPALELCRAFGGPLTATSANRSGEPPARTADEARAAVGDDVDAIVPADAPGGAPSTLVDATVDPPRVLREGALALSLHSKS
jgi:L-threonylcarbamoyladenylate synthase